VGWGGVGLTLLTLERVVRILTICQHRGGSSILRIQWLNGRQVRRRSAQGINHEANDDQKRRTHDLSLRHDLFKFLRSVSFY
jgi:hypothetical protein